MSVSVLKSAMSLTGLCTPNIIKLCPALIQSTRNCYNWSIPIQKTKLSESLQIQTIQTDQSADDRPIVLLFGWLLANPRHLNKYANLYHSKGFDVLLQQTKPMDMLIPKRCQSTMESLLHLLEKNDMDKKPILVHGFSVGAYAYGEMLVKMQQQPDKWDGVSRRIFGQIFDGPVDFDRVPFGFSNAVLKNKMAQKVMQSVIETYLKLAYNNVTKHYALSSKTFTANELSLPSLFLYSRADPVGVASRIEEVMKHWKSRGIDVYGRCWQSSPHVSHFHRHPDEYVEAMLTFLDILGVNKKPLNLSKTKKIDTVIPPTIRKPEAQQQAL